jgi:hypothetical protein
MKKKNTWSSALLSLSNLVISIELTLLLVVCGCCCCCTFFVAEVGAVVVWDDCDVGTIDCGFALISLPMVWFRFSTLRKSVLGSLRLTLLRFS